MPMPNRLTYDLKEGTADEKRAALATIAEKLSDNDGNVTAAAKALGVVPAVLHRWLSKYDGKKALRKKASKLRAAAHVGGARS